MFKYSDINMEQINGTLIWYYNICHREVWLISHGLEADQSNEYLEIGRLIHENSFQRKKKEVSIGNIKVDLIGKRDDKVVVGEVKKSSSFKKSAVLQLAFYLLTLEDFGISVTGNIHFAKEKKKLTVELNEEIREELKECISGINKIIKLDKPPQTKKTKYCGRCAYQEMCWA